MPMNNASSTISRGWRRLSVHRSALPEKDRLQTQYQLFDTRSTSIESFVTDMKAIDCWWVYNSEPVREPDQGSQQDAGLRPPFRAVAPMCAFPVAMLAYNLNCWLMLFNRKKGASR